MVEFPDPVFIDKTHLPVFTQLAKASRLVGTALTDAGIGRDLLELINVRVSQLNGCVRCLSVHVPAAREAGVDQHRLDLLVSWREATLFTPAERAALELAEALTVLGRPDALHAAQHQARKVFSEEQFAALQWGIITINTFNRISIASHHPALPAKADQPANHWGNFATTGGTDLPQ